MQCSTSTVSGTRMDLKYCERCGGLWMRERSSCLAYCGPCRSKLAQMPSRGQLRLREPSSARVADLSALASTSAAALSRTPQEAKPPTLCTKQKRRPRLPVPACSAEDLVLYPICEPSSGLNNAIGGFSFRDALANLLAIGGRS